MISLQQCSRSAAYAARGLRIVFQCEQNFRIEIFCFAAAITTAAFLRVTPWEFALVFLVGGAVLGVECVNSAMERLIDLVKPRLHEYAQDIKDIMAAAALLTSLAAAVIGAFIFVPYLL